MMATNPEEQNVTAQMNPTEALMMIMWTGNDNKRRAEVKTNTFFTMFVAVGSALLGAGFSGLVSYWYSTDNIEWLVALGWFLAIGASLAIFLIIPRQVDKYQAALYVEAGMKSLDYAEKEGLISAVVKGMAVRRLESTVKTKSKKKRKKQVGG
jgi:hypothetical protein